MSAPLRSILNDHDISPPRSARSRAAAEPVSATSTTAGPPEPTSAGSTETEFARGERRIGDHRAGPSSRHQPSATAEEEAHDGSRHRHGHAAAAGSFRSNTNMNTGGYYPGQQQAAVSQQGAPPRLVDPSLSSLAKRRRRDVHPQQQTSSSPPQSPPKRRRLPGGSAASSDVIPQQPSRRPPPPPPPPPVSALDLPLLPIFRSRPLPNSVKHVRGAGYMAPDLGPMQQQPVDLPIPAMFHSSPHPLPHSVEQHRSRPPAPPVRAPPRPPFDIFGAILTHPDVTLYLATHLSFPALLTLYSSSRPFHRIANQRFTALILGNASVHTPSALRAFPFRCYRRLCRGDPARRPHEQQAGKLRIVPSFRYLQMVLWRQRVVEEILGLLQVHGLVMPASTLETLCKLWFMMDLPDNRRRIGLVRNNVIWDNGDLWRATEFFIKLDMRFTHPENGSGSGDLRKLMMAQRSLSTLWRVLKREECRTQLEVLRMAVRTHYIPPSHRHLPILGVPPNRIGALQWEGYGARPGKRLLQIHQLVMREGIRRELPLQTWYLDMALDGFVDKKEEGEHLWENVMTQQDVKVVDVEVDEEGNEVGEESDWESEEEYFPEEKDDDEEDEKADPHPGLMGLNLFFDTDDTEFCETVAEYARYQARVRAGFRAQHEAMQW